MKEIKELVGQQCFENWAAAVEMIKSKYEMDELWDGGSKQWDFEYKFRRGGKTHCALYAKKNLAGLMIIFGGGEREKVESVRGQLSDKARSEYDGAKTYHEANG